MSEQVMLCLVCAWREKCQKKYSLQPGSRCPDFERDLAVKPDKGDQGTSPEPKG